MESDVQSPAMGNFLQSLMSGSALAQSFASGLAPGSMAHTSSPERRNQLRNGRRQDPVRTAEIGCWLSGQTA
jgi:hypothetical protein